MKLFREIILVVLLAVLPAAVSGVIQLKWREPIPEGTAEPKEGEITLAALDGQRAVLWVDARSAGKYEAGHIPGAVRLTEEEWDDLIMPVFDAWDPDGIVVVYCDSAGCAASDRVARQLREQSGLENVFVLKGGWQAWQLEQ